MWVRSKFGEMILNSNCFYINNYGNSEYSIKAMVNNEEFIIGIYNDKDKAIEQLDKIHWTLSNMKVNVFQIK